MNKPEPSSPHSRRHFLKYSSLAVGASFLAVPQLVYGGTSRKIELRGVVQSGDKSPRKLRLPGAVVNLYAATGTLPRLLGTATTNGAGVFKIKNDDLSPVMNGIFYVTADIGNGIQLVSVLGPELPEFVTLNELTTVAAGYALAQFTHEGLISGNEFALQLAAGMNDNLVSSRTGGSSPVLRSAPNGDQTNSWRSTRSLANLLAGFVQNQGAGVDVLFALTTPPGGLPPTNLLQAMSNLCRNPAQNVIDLYDLAQAMNVYSPALFQAPDVWTIVVKVNDTGSDKHLFGGPANLVFDARGYAWITNNVMQGTPNSSRFNVVLQPNGRPADGKRGTPKSPLFGGGILGAGFGIGLAPDGTVWMGNFGWGAQVFMPSADGNGSISQFSADGQPLSGPKGFQGGPIRAQATTPDALGNIWITSYDNDRVYVFPNGDPNSSFYFQEETNAGPFNIQIATDGTAWVSNSGGLTSDGPSSVARYAIQNGQLVQIFQNTPGGIFTGLKGIALDSQGQAWVASQGGNCVCLFNDQGVMLNSFSGGGMNSPWSTAVDGDDNVWVANFGPTTAGNNYSEACVTKLAGSNPDTRPPGLNTGDPISPSMGYTLPSAGDQVRLHNGEPLYGQGRPPCFSPLQRVTSVSIDRAGNLWAINNWKPQIDFDILNPGGDGICIFVGLAKPPVRNS